MRPFLPLALLLCLIPAQAEEGESVFVARTSAPIGDVRSPFGQLGGPGNFPLSFTTGGGALSEPVGIYPVQMPRYSAWSEQELARKLVPALAQFSKQHGTEACARFCQAKTGEVFAKVVTTNSHLFCVASSETCEEGEVALSSHIHSHPPQSAFCVNEADWIALGKEGKIGDCRFAGHPDSFSPEDLRAGPAFLVTGSGKLMYTNGSAVMEIMQ